MFEDLARNLVVPHQLGMTTVLVVPDGAKEVVREDWELEGRDAAYVDHVTDDLTGFLQRVVEHLSASSLRTRDPYRVIYRFERCSTTVVISSIRGYGRAGVR